MTKPPVIVPCSAQGDGIDLKNSPAAQIHEDVNHIFQNIFKEMKINEIRYRRSAECRQEHIV